MSIRSAVFEKPRHEGGFHLRMAPIFRESSENISGNLIHCHWHSEAEIIYLEAGTATVEVDTDRIELHSGQAIFVNSGEIHTAYNEAGTPCRLYALVFDYNMLSFQQTDICQEVFLNPFINNEYKIPTVITGSQEWEADLLMNIRHLIDTHYDRAYGYELQIKACLYSIVFTVIKNRKYISVEKEYNNSKNYKIQAIKKILTHIDDNLNKKLLIPDLAGLANMSTTNFFRFFKAMTQNTPVEYINYSRVEKAKEMLERSNINVLEASLKAGFENVSYFIKTFKRYTGCTPNEYRKRLGKI